MLSDRPDTLLITERFYVIKRKHGWTEIRRHRVRLQPLCCYLSVCQLKAGRAPYAQFKYPREGGRRSQRWVLGHQTGAGRAETDSSVSIQGHKKDTF